MVYGMIWLHTYLALRCREPGQYGAGALVDDAACHSGCLEPQRASLQGLGTAL